METQHETAAGPQAARARAESARYEGLDRLWIDGAWRQGRTGRRAADVDPFTGQTLVEVSLGNGHDVDEAYQVAQRSQRAWARVLPQERRAVLDRAALVLEQRRREIIDWLIRESGSVRAKAALEWQWTRLGLLEATSYPFHVEGRTLSSVVPGKESSVYRRPVGVVGVISPWSFPLYLTMRAVAPALAVGNAVVLEPASDTPVTGGLLVAKIFEEAGLPAGVLNVVTGSPDDLGDAMIDHPIPRVLAFTGSTAVGRRVAEHAGRHIKRVCLELGGNTPFIVFEDADLDRAVDAAVAGKFLHQGQSCLAVNRILVHRAVHDELLQRFVARASSLRCGDPGDDDTAIGPLIHKRQLDRIRRIVEDTLRRGARPVLMGTPLGLVLPPIVLAGVSRSMPTAREEVFGPVASFLSFEHDAEAIDLANDSDVGLSSAVFTRNLDRGMRVAHQLDVGMTHINDWPVNDEPDAAFGGEKGSGLGRFGGRWALDELSTSHWISVQQEARSYPI